MLSTKTKSLFTLALFLSVTFLDAQSIGINTNNPHPSAILDINSADRGVLFPRMTSEKMTLIQSPEDGLVVYNIEEKDLFMHIDGNWNPIGTGGLSGFWLPTGNGVYYPNGVGIGTSSILAKFNLTNSSSTFPTSAIISNSYSGPSQANGLSVSVSGSTGNQIGILSSFTPNSDPTKSAVGFSTGTPFFGGGGAANKEVIGFNASISNSTLGKKTGIKINSKGAQNWAAFLEGRAYISEKTIIGGDPETNLVAALTVNNDNTTAGIANLRVENSFTSNCWTGIQNTFTASNSTSNSYYGTRTDVVGGGPTKTIYGHFISVGGAIGNKTGLYVNASGNTNWASYFNGRSYISDQLLIGTEVAAVGYKLSVDGKIACEEVRVEMSDAWPDYVFAEDYDLKSIDAVEKSIHLNGHLPGIPSAAEIEANGLEIGEMQKNMMEKIEELTLYIIALNKENKELKIRMEKLEQN